MTNQDINLVLLKESIKELAIAVILLFIFGMTLALWLAAPLLLVAVLVIGWVRSLIGV